MTWTIIRATMKQTTQLKVEVGCDRNHQLHREEIKVEQLGHHLPDISVVVPSIGRAELARALDSVDGQDYAGRVEKVVVFDLDEAEVSEDLVKLASRADVVEFTGGGRRGGYARNLGVARASGDWIAFLDDDDAWAPSKLRVQMELAQDERARGAIPVVGCRVQQIVAKETKLHILSGIPARLVESGEKIEEYLFVRRRPGARRPSFFTSTILTEKSLFASVPWDETLARHQDWDWLVRAGKVPNVFFVQSEADLVSYYVGSAGSISAGAAWSGSLDWATQMLAPLGARVFVDFVAAQTMRYALQKRDWSGVRRVAESIIEAKRVPSFGPMIIGAAGLIPRTALENLMRRIR